MRTDTSWAEQDNAGPALLGKLSPMDSATAVLFSRESLVVTVQGGSLKETRSLPGILPFIL